MELGILQFFFTTALLSFISIVAGLGSTLTVDKITITNAPNNPYFGEWSAEIHGAGEKVSIKVPVLKDVPPMMMVKTTFELAGTPLPVSELTLCDIFEDETIGKGAIACGIPKGSFPTSCPVKASGDYVVSNYLLPGDKVLPGVPPGRFTADLSVFEIGKEPYVNIHLEGDIKSKIPGIGR